MAGSDPMYLILFLMFMSVIDLADHSSANNQVKSKRCEKIAECGEFLPPTGGAVTYTCKLNKRCEFSCTMKCPSLNMIISNRRHARELFVCNIHRGVWRRKDTPKAYCKAKLRVNEVSQNLHHIEELNQLATRLLNSSFFYLGMASFFERADVALPGFSNLMTGLWKQDLDHARDVITYVNKRGGYINFEDIPRPTSVEELIVGLHGRPAQLGLTMALAQCKEVNQQALTLHTTSMRKKKYADPHLKLFLDEGVLAEKVKTIKKLADLLSQLEGFPEEDYPLGQYSMDVKLQ